MAIFPALDVRSRPTDTLLALVDDFAATALDERDDSLRLFFSSAPARDRARTALGAAGYQTEPIDVDDEDWARRSQESLQPVTVGRITVAPALSGVVQVFRPAQAPAASRECLAIVIQPSMGFGTGHHATTRLCLRGLQEVDLANRFVLDVGTGSGVLAIAAVRLGAARALGIDHDADAIAAANDNLRVNSGTERVDFRVADLTTADLPQADIVTANLTGAALIRSAPLLLSLVRPAGALIVSGLLEHERDDVVNAFRGAGLSGPTLGWEQTEEGWTALTFVL